MFLRCIKRRISISLWQIFQLDKADDRLETHPVDAPDHFDLRGVLYRDQGRIGLRAAASLRRAADDDRRGGPARMGAYPARAAAPIPSELERVAGPGLHRHHDHLWGDVPRPRPDQAGIASVLGNLQALATVVLAAVFLGERLTRGKGLALALGLAGVTLIAYPALTGPDAYGVSGPVLALAVSISSAQQHDRQAHANPEQPAGGHRLAADLGGLPLLAFSAWLEAGRDYLDPAVRRPVALPGPGGLRSSRLPGTGWYSAEDVGRLSIFFYLVGSPDWGSPPWPSGGVGLFEGAGVAFALAGIGA
jgi:hypothetical protein